MTEFLETCYAAIRMQEESIARAIAAVDDTSISVIGKETDCPNWMRGFLCCGRLWEMGIAQPKTECPGCVT